MDDILLSGRFEKVHSYDMIKGIVPGCLVTHEKWLRLVFVFKYRDFLIIKGKLSPPFPPPLLTPEVLRHMKS